MSLCSDCGKLKTRIFWCQNCNSKRFQENFDKWTSGNELIDKFIQDAQLKARNYNEVIEWIPYNRLRNILFLACGGFSTVYKAIWLDGYIEKWNNERNQWCRHINSIDDEDCKNAKAEDVKSPLDGNENRFGKINVVLKSLNNSKNINPAFLEEWENYLKFVYSAENDRILSVQLYGITQDPETLNYMVVLNEVKLGNLRDNLMIKKYNPNDKYGNLYYLAKSLSALHKCNLFHGDLHSGNLLLSTDMHAHISDLGLSRPADKPSKSGIYGVIPYIAPEVLNGKPYTKAADIYSFGIIMWEMTSGVPAFSNVPHDFELILNICHHGLRPRIVEGTEFEYIELMKRCWDQDPEKRPSSLELIDYFKIWKNKHRFNWHERVPVPENTSPQYHPKSCYTSRLINFSAKLIKIPSKTKISHSRMPSHADCQLTQEDILEFLQDKE